MSVLDVLKVIGVLACLALVAWAAFIVWRGRTGPAPVGQPTPKEAEIVAQTQKTAGEIAADAEKKSKELLNADREEQLRLSRERLSRGMRGRDGK